MENFDKNKLKKLSPKERIKALKKLEENRKKEATEIEDLLKKSEEELKTEKVADEISPVPREINIGDLFEEEENLETEVKKDSKEKPGIEYISFKQAYSDYQQLQDISYASIIGDLDQNQMEAIDEIGERLDKTKYTSQSAQAADLLVASRAALNKIKKYAGLN